MWVIDRQNQWIVFLAPITAKNGRISAESGNLNFIESKSGAICQASVRIAAIVRDRLIVLRA
ncbi:hypothetical protein AYM39_00300 [Methylomonas sp. DH-1]|nr:hypothetical protein AYM39_00300 [Methylomonas sp. DH-1]